MMKVSWDTRYITNNKDRFKRGGDTKELDMFGKLFSAVRGFGPATDFEGYLSSLLAGDHNGQMPTIDEARREYRVIVQERTGFIDRF